MMNIVSRCGFHAGGVPVDPIIEGSGCRFRTTKGEYQPQHHHQNHSLLLSLLLFYPIIMRMMVFLLL